MENKVGIKLQIIKETINVPSRKLITWRVVQDSDNGNWCVKVYYPFNDSEMDKWLTEHDCIYHSGEISAPYWIFPDEQTKDWFLLRWSNED